MAPCLAHALYVGRDFLDVVRSGAWRWWPSFRRCGWSARPAWRRCSGRHLRNRSAAWPIFGELGAQCRIIGQRIAPAHRTVTGGAGRNLTGRIPELVQVFTGLTPWESASPPTGVWAWKYTATAVHVLVAQGIDDRTHVRIDANAGLEQLQLFGRCKSRSDLRFSATARWCCCRWAHDRPSTRPPSPFLPPQCRQRTAYPVQGFRRPRRIAPRRRNQDHGRGRPKIQPAFVNGDMLIRAPQA